MDSENGIARRFGQRVRQLRRERNWTQDRLAAETRLDRSYVSHVERGEVNIALVNIARIALAFQLSLAELLQGVPNHPDDLPLNRRSGGMTEQVATRQPEPGQG